jgi:polyisoprenoid-binding protein YceI
MNRFLRTTLLVSGLIGSALIGAVASAAPEPQIIDVAHSTLDFTAQSLLIDAEGTFKEWKGAVNLDKDDMTKSTVEVTIDAKSIDTRIDKRNDHLRSADFFDVAKYPSITFKSTKIVKTGDKSYDMTGDLTIKGVTKPVTLAVVVDRVGDPYTRFKATGKLSRSAFGVSYNSSLNPIEDEIKFNMVINVRKPAKQ